MSITKIDIANGSYALIGQSPISSFTSSDPASVRVNTIYEGIVEHELSVYPWRFATKQQQLSRLVDTPVGKWSAAYQIPSDCLRIIGLFVGDERLRYDRYDGYVYCDANEDEVVYMEYVFRASEDKWSPYFTQSIKYKLASLLGGSLGRDANLVGNYDSLYQREIAKARTTDAQSQSTRKIRTDLLTRFRKI